MANIDAMRYSLWHKVLVKKVLLLILLLGMAGWCSGQVVVRMQMDTTQILVGQQVEVQAKVQVQEGKNVCFPEYSYKEYLVPGVEVLKCGRVDTAKIGSGNQLELTRRYTLTSFDSALYSLPPIEVEVDGKKYSASNGVGLKVSWMPVDTLNLDVFADPHTVVPETFIWKPSLAVNALPAWVALGVMLIVAIVLTRNKPLVRKKIVKPRITPNKEAQSTLEKIKSDGRTVDVLDDKEFYVALTELLRVYLERRFMVAALQQTTDEIIQGLYERVNASQKESLRELFVMADEVKFAKGKVSAIERQRHIKIVEAFLAETYDDVMEHPQPEVVTIVLSDGMQQGYRKILWLVWMVSIISLIAYTAYSLKEILNTYM